MYSDDIDSDDDEGVSIKKEMKYKKYLDGKILKNVEAELNSIWRKASFGTKVEPTPCGGGEVE